MLSPYKLYKADKALARKPVTWGPKGRPDPRNPKDKGTACYRHYNVDWTVHRLTPTVAARGKPGGKRRTTIGKLAHKVNGGKGGRRSYELKRRPVTELAKGSPRWGEGVAPGRTPRKAVPLQKKGTVEVSKGTYVATGATAANATALQHRRSSHQGAQKRS